MDRDIKLLGLAAAYSALQISPNEISAWAVAGAKEENKDIVPAGRVVQDPVFRSIMAEGGLDPDRMWYPPTGTNPGDMTVDDLFKWSTESARRSLANWLPEGKGTDRGAFEVDLVNSFVEELFPIISDEGAEWAYSLGPAETLLHDLLDEVIPIPDELQGDELVAWVQDLLDIYQSEGG